MKVTGSSIVLGALNLALLVACAFLYYLYRTSDLRVAELQAALTDLTEKEKKSVIVRHISKQMEEIAYQQKEISEMQREEAVTQTRVAMTMRQRAEKERENALDAEGRAVQALNLAEGQRRLAEEQRLQAEKAKRVADTLGYVALGRSLGSLSTTQFQAGNEELAALLAYAAWDFTMKYNGDVFLPAIFNALSSSSQSTLARTEHKGAVMGISLFPSSPRSFVTVSKYGEVIRWNSQGEKLQKQVLFRNADYDFRDVYVDEGNTVYALSYNGHLLVIPEKAEWKDIVLGCNKLLYICPLQQMNRLLLVSDKSLTFFYVDKQRIGKSIPLTESVSSVGNKDGRLLLFGAKGNAFELSADDALLPVTVPVEGKVTAYAWSSSLGISALGMDSGDIYLVDKAGRDVRLLVGHRSAITQLSFSDGHLLSSSYDCTVNLWNVQMQKIESVTLRTFPSWVHCFNSSFQKGTLWVGDETGTLSKISVSPLEMAEKIRMQLKRDFTRQEWEYYIGNSIPFESFTRQVK